MKKGGGVPPKLELRIMNYEVDWIPCERARTQALHLHQDTRGKVQEVDEAVK